MTIEDVRREIHAYRQKKGSPHVEGLCGHMASLCGDCFDQELSVYRRFAAERPARKGETPQAYWLRIGGEFGDAWYCAAHEAVQLAVA